MKNLLEILATAIPFLEPYPVWIKSVVALWLVLTTVVVICLLFGHPKKLDVAQSPEPKVSQTLSISKATHTNVYQATGNINITNVPPILPKKSIQSLLVEVRLTCDLKEGAELPPPEVTFIPVGNAHCYFKGAAGTSRIEFKSPVRFRRQDPNKIVVINRFALESGSELQHKPLEFLKNYNFLSVPVVTVVYGKSLQKITLLEVVLNANGEDIWYGSYRYDIPFQVGPRFEVPLDEFHKKL